MFGYIQAYKKFGGGVEIVQEEVKKIIKAGVNGIALSSPNADVPSPSPFEDPFAQGVEAVAGYFFLH